MPFRRPHLLGRASGSAALGVCVAAGVFVWSVLPDGPRAVAAPEPDAVPVAAVEHPALGLLVSTPASTRPPVPSEPAVGSLGDQLRAEAKAAAKAMPTPTPAAREIPADPPAAARPSPSLSAATPATTAPAPAAAGAMTATALQPADLLGGGIPTVALAAYVRGAAAADAASPGCHLSWAILAGIGRVESNHGRFGGSTLGADGRATPPIIGPRLDGTKYPAVRDTDGGALDGDPAYDHAVGPLQFLPSTWARWGRDGDGDGRADPQDINDAAAAAGAYLCSGGGDLRDGAALGRALWSYNHDAQYVLLVAGVAADYARGAR